MNAKQIYNQFSTDPEFRIELILANNPEGVIEAMTVNGYLADIDQNDDMVRAEIFNLIVQNRLIELDQLLAVVPIIPENLSPNAIIAISSISEDITGRNKSTDQMGNPDWSNMSAWGQIFGGLGGLFGLPDGTTEENPTFDPAPPAAPPPPPAESPVMVHLKKYWPYYLAAVAVAALSFYYFKPNKK
jgi:hypothetical protein